MNISFLQSRLLAKLKGLFSPPEAPEGFSQYEMRLPQHQNAIDALPGWNSSFPQELNLTAGTIPLFADDRIFKMLEAVGALEGKTVLEVGPLEGMHTYILNQRRPAHIDAIEANKQCFMRCLVTKEILKLDRAVFYLGDIQNWLQASEHIYDLTLASGVLYHMPDPGEFLRLLAEHSRSLFLWTHYYDEHVMPKADVRHTPFSGNMDVRTIAGLDVRYFERSYQFANMSASFCGGMKDRHYWMHREDILKLLTHLGFQDIVVQSEEPLHTGGPCFSVFARRTS